MERIKIIEYTRKSMQRLGFLKLVCSIAQSEDSIANFSSKFFKVATKIIPLNVFENKELVSSFFQRKMNLSTKYKNINWEQVKEICNSSTPISYQIHIEIQDIYLSDINLNSNTGSIFPDGIRDFPTLAQELYLLKNNFIIASRGDLIRKLSPDFIDNFRSYSQSTNPFNLDLKSKIIFLFYILSEDFDLLKFLIPRLSLRKIFSIKDSSDMVSDSIKEAIIPFSKYLLNANEKQLITKLEKTSNSIKYPKGKVQGTGRSLYQFFLGRAEMLCDLDIILKDNKSGMEYIANDNTKLLSDYFLNSKSNDELLNNYFSLINSLYELNSSSNNKNQNDFILNIKKYSPVLKSQVGFVPIVESIILTNLNTIFSSNSSYVEINKGIQFIKNFQKDFPKESSFAVDRQGKLVSIKFLE